MCAGDVALYEFSYLNRLSTCHMIWSNCTASICTVGFSSVIFLQTHSTPSALWS